MSSSLARPPSFRAFLKCPKPSLSVLLLCVVCLSYPVLSQNSSVATFYGAYQRIRPLPRDEGLHVVLNFKTSKPTGLLLAVRLDHPDQDKSNAGYLAVGINNRQLLTQVSEDATTTYLSSDFSLQVDEWYSLSVDMIHTNITIKLVGGGVLFSSVHSLSSQLTVRDSYVGGANNFFARVFSTLNMTQYFVGCFANSSFNGRGIEFAPKVERYGMEYGCCPNPEPIMWCFESGILNSFVFENRLIHTRFQTSVLTLSFEIHAEQNGMVFYSHDENTDFALAIEIHNGRLLVHLANEESHFESYNLTCDGFAIDGLWHKVSVSIEQDLLQCSVDGTRSQFVPSNPTLPPRSLQFHIGSAEVPTQNLNLQLFQTNLYTIPKNGMFLSFGGCLGKFQLNGLDVSPTEVPRNTSPSLSPACPVLESSRICQQIQEELLPHQLGGISFNASNLTVNEGDSTLLTERKLIFHADGVPQSMKEIMKNTIHFSVTSPPTHGVLSEATSPSQSIRQFSYSDLENRSITYTHNGDGASSDELHLLVTSTCLSAISHNLVLNFNVNLFNDFPVVTRQGTINIAVGTRRVITADMITVEDEETSDLINISYKVKAIHVVDCNPCEEAGRVEKTTNFNQAEVNGGEVLFQHFPQFGTSPIVIRLQVSDRVGASIEVELDVAPYVGHLNLTRNEPLSLVEGRCSNITSQHLNAATDFDDQNPILQYNITSVPEHGYLRIRDQGYWLRLPNSVLGFTQHDIDHHFVQYCHNNRSLATDVFQFQLHSTHLVADSGDFTINVFAYADLPQPIISLSITPLDLTEGGEVIIVSDSLSVSLQSDVSFPWSDEMIRIEDLGIFFHLERPPSFGEILYDGDSLPDSTGFSLEELVEGLVTYRHDESENHMDNMTVRVQATNSADLPIKSPLLPPVVNVTFNIRPVNNHFPQIGTLKFSLSEGRFVILTPDVLSVTDSDRPPQTITLTILNQDEDYGYFALSNTETPIVSFTTDDIQAGRVNFHHRLDPSFPLIYDLEIQASDGEWETDQRVQVEAIPLTISTSLVETGDCIAHLDAIEESLSVLIPHTPFLAIQIMDEHGMDQNRLDDMILRVSDHPDNGQLLWPNMTDTFKLNDIRNNWLSYNFSNQTTLVESDFFTVEVSYGHSRRVNLTFKICINPVPRPIVEAINAIFLPTNTSTLIDNNTFRAVDSRGRGGDAITYTILVPPRLGRVVDKQNSRVETFTQSDIDERRIYYHHQNQTSSTLEDYFIIKLCTEYHCTRNYNVTVTFRITNLTIFNNGLRIDEGGILNITKDRLYALSPQGEVQFHILRPPSEGTLYRNAGIIYPNIRYFSTREISEGRIYYNHSGSEEHRDSFTFSVTAGNSRELATDIFIIDINPINDNQPILVGNTVQMIARTTRNITSNDIFAYDVDGDADSKNLQYRIIISPDHGVFHYRNDTELHNPLTTWYEREIRNNQIAYTHTANERLEREIRDVVGVQLYDGFYYKSQIILIYINEIQLNLDKFTLNVIEGGRGRIDRGLLRAIAEGDATLTDSDLHYTLYETPQSGNLTLRGLPVVNFTQADLNNPGLFYQHDHSNTKEDSFSFNVSILRHNATEQGTFKISIDYIDDDPPILIFKHQPLFVVEGGTIILTNQYLDVIDNDTNMNSSSQTNRINFQIISLPRHGEVKRRIGAVADRFKTTGSFTLFEVNHVSVEFKSYPHNPYANDIGDRWTDSFLVNLTDGAGNTHDTPYNFSFIILPDVVVVEAASFTVPEGKNVTVPNETIKIGHPFLRTQTGCIIITEFPKNGTLSNLRTGEMNITNFTTTDLGLGLIKYHHNDAEKEKDRLKFVYEAHRPQLDHPTQPGPFPDAFMRTSDEKVLDILVDTVNDRGPEVRSDPRKILVMWAEDCVFLSVKHLDIIDADTPNNRLIYSFNFTFNAYISHINVSNSIRIESFTQEDVVNSLIKLFHRSGKNGTMYYTVTDGVFSVSSYLIIETLRVEILVLNNNPLSVAMNGMVPITSNDLNISRTDEENTRNITRCSLVGDPLYTFEVQYGEIVVEGISGATSFTQTHVNKGLVFYNHTKPELWESLDILKLKVKATLTNVKEIHMNVTINLPSEPYSPLAVHKSLVVREGGEACLNESILDARNIRYNASKDAFNASLVTWFYFRESSHGEILVDKKRQNESGSIVKVTQDEIAGGIVCYRNFGDEISEDPVDFYVEILDRGEFRRGGTEKDQVLNISVILINDESPVVSGSMLLTKVVEGFSAHITNKSLLITDEDNPASDLMYTILKLPPGGYLWLGSRQLRQQEHFNQSEVNEGVLKFYARDVGTWTMKLNFTDGEFVDFTNFTVIVDELYIKLESTKVLRYPQNETGTHITPLHIVTQTNGDPNDTVYIVHKKPHSGFLKGLNGEIEKFTQSDLKAGNITYIPNDINSHSDSFALNITNRNATIEEQTIVVKVQVDVWGQVKQNTELNFENVNDKSLPLPKDLLELLDLQRVIKRPPRVHITRQPKLGFLEIKIPSKINFRRSVNRGDVIDFFDYNYLDRSYVYYTWNATNATVTGSQDVYMDSFSILVEGYHSEMYEYQPGEATITLYIRNPPIEEERNTSTTEVPTSTETAPTTRTTIEDDQNSGFPNYALLPILGVFIVLVIIIIVVIIFCVTQQGRIRKKWQPRMPGHHWGARDQNFALHASNIYEIEPTAQGMTTLEMIDRGSEYPERHSPTSRYSPSASHPPNGMYPPSEVGPSYHHRHMVPRPRSRRSNVSVSYSQRLLPEITLDGLPRGRHHTFSPTPLSQYDTPLPSRPVTHCSIEGGEGESGYLSTPNPSVIADEPVQLLRRSETLSPQPELTDEVEREGPAENEGRSEEHTAGVCGSGVEGQFQEGSSRGEVCQPPESEVPQSTVHQTSQQSQEQVHLTSAEQPSELSPLQNYSEENRVLCSSNGANAVSCVPLPEPEAIPAHDVLAASASSTGQPNTATTSSDLHAVFRTHNPILKRTEYWV